MRAASHVHDIGDAVLDYWTDERMESPLDTGGMMPGAPEKPPLLPGADNSGYVLMPTPYAEHDISRVNGILFYRRANGQDGHCSASVIASHGRSLVLTVKHCVSTDAVWNQMLMFVPAYNGGVDAPVEEQAPLGKWPIKQAFVPSLEPSGTFEDDIAVVSVYPRAGQWLEDVVGDSFQPLETESGGSFDSLDLYGYPETSYPEDGPYHGEQRHCRSPAITLGQSSMLDLPHCAAQDGNSGGPIVLELPGFSWFVVGVVNSAHAYPRLLRETFHPIYEAADESVTP